MTDCGRGSHSTTRTGMSARKSIESGRAPRAAPPPHPTPPQLTVLLGAIIIGRALEKLRFMCECWMGDLQC